MIENSNKDETKDKWLLDSITVHYQYCVPGQNKMLKRMRYRDYPIKFTAQIKNIIIPIKYDIWFAHFAKKWDQFDYIYLYNLNISNASLIDTESKPHNLHLAMLHYRTPWQPCQYIVNATNQSLITQLQF